MQRLSSYIDQLKLIESKFNNRKDFHKHASPLLEKMGNDKSFLKQVIERNFLDEGFLNFDWSDYNIPFLYIFENDFINLKLHLFPSTEENNKDLALHCIHHHNNYILTSYAFFGSGYESMIFEPKKEVESNLESTLKLKKQFHQNNWNPSIVNSWEPHVVFNPESLSATLALWTPDEKRKTDNLRQNKFLKPYKNILRKGIQLFHLESKFGIAKKNTYQWYPSIKGNFFQAVDEDEYFSLSRSQKGDTIKIKSMQLICSFIQKADLVDKDFFSSILKQKKIPSLYIPLIKKLVAGDIIEEVYHNPTINIPSKMFYKEDILKNLD